MGIGDNPTNWKVLETDREEFQIRAEDVLILNIADFTDSSYTLRLVVNRIDAKTQEERVTFGVDRSPPNILVHNISNAFLNHIETVQASIVTDDLSSAKLYYRDANSNEEFEFILLNGFNNSINNISDKHFGFLPADKITTEFDLEFYFEITNLSGLSSKLLDGNEYFRLSNSIKNAEITNIKKSYTLPEGRIFETPVSLKKNEKFVLLNASNSSANLGIYRLNQHKFVKEDELKNKIPISINDLNGDNKQDLLNLYVKNGYIDSQSEIGGTAFVNKFTDSSQTFWPAYSEDIDNDGNYEIIAFSSDTTITIWEVDSDLNLTEEASLKIQSTNSAFFRNNIILVDNFDDDPNSEIVTVDNFGRLMIFEIKGPNLYSNDKIVEYFLPTDSRAAIAKGDYNGDGKIDIGILLNFEENIFLTPLIYASVINIDQFWSKLLI